MTSPHQGSKTPEMRLFYDPSGRHADMQDEVFYRAVAEQRPETYVAGFGALHGDEITLADSLHTRQDTPESVLAIIRPERAALIHDFVHERAQNTAHYIGTLALAKAEEIPHFSGYTDVFPDGEIDTTLLGARLLGAIACHGIFRRDGKPYVTHPESVASIAEAGWRRFHRNGEDTTQLRLLKAISYLHDAWEDSVDHKGGYLAHPIIASPLTAKYLMDTADFPYADDVAQSMHLMSHTNGLFSKKLNYTAYIDRVIEHGTPEARMSKAADIQHNSELDVDKDFIAPTLNQRRRAKKYDNAKQRLLLDETVPFRDTMVTHMIFDITREEMDHYYTRLQRCHIDIDTIDLQPTIEPNHDTEADSRTLI